VGAVKNSNGAGGSGKRKASLDESTYVEEVRGKKQPPKKQLRGKEIKKCRCRKYAATGRSVASSRGQVPLGPHKVFLEEN